MAVAALSIGQKGCAPLDSPEGGGPRGPSPLISASKSPGHGNTVVSSASLLFAVSVSGLCADTSTVFVMVPFLVGLTSMTTVTVSPAVMLPMVHTTVRRCTAQVPFVVEADPKPAFLGNMSVRTTPVAVDGPWLVTGMV